MTDPAIERKTPMMNNTPLPPTNTDPSFALVAALLTTLNDPAATQERLNAIMSATDAHNAALAEVRNAQAKFEKDTAATREAIAAERQAAEEEIERRRTLLGVDAAAVRERATVNEARAAELEQQAAALANREAEITRRENAFSAAAENIRRVGAGQ
jgi:hypothetical protein